MAICIEDERLLKLAKAAKTLPGNPASSTLFRWASRGIRGVRLETCLIGGVRYTSREAIQRFVDATTCAGEGQPDAMSQTRRAREADVRRDERYLASEGI